MKLQIKRGLPGSGKTTEARKTVADSGNHGRLNRDDLRAMLFNSVWTPHREKVVIAAEKALAWVLKEHDMSVIVDDTNLSNNHVEMWKAVARKIGMAVEVDPLVVDIAKSVEQDSWREKPIGKAIIHRMALNNGLIDFGEKPIVIVDIDGTIADGTHREGFLKGERKDWKSYFERCTLDSPIEFVIDMVRTLDWDHTICIVSGRPDTYQFETMEWLDRYGVPYDYIFMRPGNLKSPDTEIKKAILDKMPKYLVKAVFDDRPSVLEMWGEQGLKNVIPVRGAIDEF